MPVPRTYHFEVDIWNRKNVTYTKYVEVWAETREDPSLIAAQLSAALCPEGYMVVEVRLIDV